MALDDHSSPRTFLKVRGRIKGTVVDRVIERFRGLRTKVLYLSTPVVPSFPSVVGTPVDVTHRVTRWVRFRSELFVLPPRHTDRLIGEGVRE